MEINFDEASQLPNTLAWKIGKEPIEVMFKNG